MTCRERAGQVRERYEEILSTGAQVVAVGTGGKRYAKAFIEDLQIPFEVLLDEDGSAAEIVGTTTIGIGMAVNPKAWIAGARAVKAAGATALRGGAFKPRTSPYSFQGLKEEGLRILATARAETRATNQEAG